jgi:hypothetical protein
VNRQFLEMVKDLLRIFPFARHRVDMSKAGPYLSYASKRYSLFKRSNGLKRETLQNEILNAIERKSTVYTDRAPAYDHLKVKDFVHETVNHVEEYVRGQVHTH